MNKITDIPKDRYFQVIKEFSDAGIHQENLYIILYLFTIYKEGLKFKVITEQKSLNSDSNLFGEKENKLDLYSEHTRLILENVPEEKKVLYKVNEVFNKFLIKNQSVMNLLKDWDPVARFGQLDPYLRHNHFAEIFEVFLEIIIGAQGKKVGEFILPTEVGKFIIKLANLDKNQSVFNPFAGLATFGVSLADDQEYLGHEINELIWAVAILRLNAHNRLTRSNFLIADSFNNWPSSSQFDLVIANPPFRLSLSKKQQADYEGAKLIEEFFLKEGVKLLKPQGKLITIVPHGFLSSHSDIETRQFLVEQDLLEAVITFPGGLLTNTNISFVVLLINKNKSHKGKIAFFNGSQYVTSKNPFNKVLKPEGFLEEIRETLKTNGNHYSEPNRTYKFEDSLLPELISEKVIAENHYYLDIKRYWLKNLDGTALSDAIEVEESFSLKQLQSFVEDKNKIRYKQGIPFATAKYISTKHLKTDPKDSTIDIQSLENKEFRNGYFINKDVYVISLIGGNLKPSFLPAGDTIIHLSNEIIPFSIKESLVDPSWLLKELVSNKVKEQLEVLTTGVIPRLQKNDFLNIKINIPSKKEQILEVQKIKGLEHQVDSLESDIIQQNSYLRHTVAGPLSDLDHALKAIDTILKNISENEMPRIMKAKVSDEHLYTLGEHLEDSKKHVTIILDTITNKLSASQSIEQKKLEKLNLLNHIEKYVKRKNENTTSLGYYIDFDFDKDFFNSNPNTDFEFILGNKELVNTLLDNMINNAVKHAFEEGEKNKVEIYVWGYDEDAANKRIFFTVANTGKRLPKNITLNELKRRGFRNGGKKGDGFGLYLVNEIVRKHKGDWFLVDDLWDENKPEKEYMTILGRDYPITKEDYVTKFSFSFPILEE